MTSRPAFEKVASIAGLPFVSCSRDEEDEYFSDGLAVELFNMLAEIRTSLNLRPRHGDPRWGAFLRKMGFDG